MQNLGAIFLSSFAIGFSGALMPGPLLSTTISESGRRGWVVGPLFILGHAVLDIAPGELRRQRLLLIAGLFLGLAPLLTSNTAFIVIAFAGGTFMLWMAWGMFRSLPSLSLAGAAAAGVTGSRRSSGETGRPLALTGALMSLANPYWIIWWATIGLGYVISSREAGLMGVAAFFTGHILADLVWYAFVSFAVDKGRRILPDLAYKLLIGVCGTFLAGYAVYLIVGGVGRLV